MRWKGTPPPAAPEGEVHAPCELAERGLAVLARDEQLVVPEGVVVELATQRDAERAEGGVVEAPAGSEVFHHELHMIDEASTLQFHD